MKKKMSLQAMQAVMVDMAYDRDMVSTDLGRRSFELREQAQRLCEGGDREAAVELFHRAVAVFPESDDSAAAAAACHDLANMLSDRRDGPSLVSAEELYRRALRSPARARVHRRCAETENSLGICLRRQARMVGGAERKRLLDEAEALYRSALQRLDGVGMAGWETLANVHLNLGNLLWQDRRLMEPALREYARAARVAREVLQKAREAGEEPRFSTRKAFNMAYLSSAGIHLIRRENQDLAQAEQLVKRVLEAGDPRFEPLAWLELADIILAGDASDRHERARSLLIKVRPDRLDAEHHLLLAGALRRAQAPEAALELLRKCIDRGIHYRALKTIADFDADSASEAFQEAAAMAARIQAQELNQPVGAFLSLENASGLRFSESLSSMTWHPKDAVLQELHERLSDAMGQTWTLAGTASILERLDPEGQRRHIDKILEGSSHLSNEAEEDHTTRSLKEARASSVPLHYLQRTIEEGRRKVIRRQFVLAERDEGYRDTHVLLGADLSAADLEELLRAEPGLVLVRLSLDTDLLVVSVWLEGDRLEARSTTVPVEFELLRRLSRATEEPRQVDFERLSALLAGLDISAVFPPGYKERLVLLPSYWAATLPLTAIGPRGSRPIDRFGSILWLPCLFPLRTRQAPHPPRTGHLVVVPETTHFHGLALSEPLPGEHWLVGSAATPEAVEKALSEVDTISIYAHGQHDWGDSPVISLKGGELNFLLFGKKALRGIERVENWACESGAHRPADPMTPPVDEAFGLDFELLMRGVRSAIGTLWKVPDLVTAAMVRFYRRQLSAGRDAASALAEAQRWWEGEGLPVLLQSLRERPQREAIVQFSRSLGFELEPGAQPAPLGLLAPVSSQLGESELKTLAARFACPVSWAGLRFVGLPERRPLQPWSTVENRPLTEEERREVDQLENLEPPAPKSFDELQEEQLASAWKLPDVSPSPGKAIEMARRMRERLSSSYRDNLLLGLAWLHEALAAPELPLMERARLSIEAAHLWLDVAQGEELFEALPSQVVLARAGALLDAVPELGSELDADARAARARLRWFRELELHGDDGSFDGPLRLARECLEEARAAMARVGTGSFESLRVATVALELLRFRGKELGPEGAQVLSAARVLLSSVEPRLENRVSLARLHASLNDFEPDEELAGYVTGFLSPRELWLMTGRTLERTSPPPPGSTEIPPFLNDAFAHLEGRIWGYAKDDRSLLLVSVGTTGKAHRQLLSRYLAGHAIGQPDDAAHLIACLQYASDLRVGFLHRLARFCASFGEDAEALVDLWRLVRSRQALHTALRDATLMPEITVEEGVQQRPHRLDPYALPVDRLHTSFTDLTCASAWELAGLCDAVMQGEHRARTTAFEAARASAWMEAETLDRWKQLLELEKNEKERHELDKEPLGLAGLLSPENELRANEDALRSLPSGRGILSLVLEPSGFLLAMVCWNGGTTRGQQVLRVEARGLRDALIELLRPFKHDATAARGLSTLRRETWAQLEAALAPVLEALLVPDGERPALSWSLFAPGSLRALPLLGLRVKGKVLAEHVRGLSHAPCLGFGARIEPEQEGRDFTACLLARERHHGTTRFGEAAMETLRRAHPPELLVDVRERPPATVVEVDALEPHAERIRTLRLYGVGGIESINDTLALLRLEGGQALRDRNTHEMRLTRCRVVELWACTAGSADIERTLRDDGDRIPGLAASFLCNGADAVIDLAWPVHDLVKALVCEQYGWLRRTRGHGPETLSLALGETRSILEMLRGLPAGSSLGEVLRCLDELRRLSARKHGFTASFVVPFAPGSGEPEWQEPVGDGIVDELCHPLHLGAFRWWGN
jgi:hypothetical protein